MLQNVSRETFCLSGCQQFLPLLPDSSIIPRHVPFNAGPVRAFLSGDHIQSMMTGEDQSLQRGFPKALLVKELLFKLGLGCFT